MLSCQRRPGADNPFRVNQHQVLEIANDSTRKSLGQKGTKGQKNESDLEKVALGQS
jgi:hypothetical protein